MRYNFSIILIVIITVSFSAIAQDEKVVIFNLQKINTNGLEYAPMISPDGKNLIFVSDREGSVINTTDNTYTHDFWISDVFDAKKNGYSLPSNFNDYFGSNLNTALNEGTSAMTFDGKTIYFTACDRPYGFGSCDIYVSHYEYGVWTTPVALNRNINSGSYEAHPSISPDGKTLFYASTKKGPNSSGSNKPGNMDIWYSEWDEDDMDWGESKNLIDINTGGSETSPFIAPDNKTLFFSSDKFKPNYGGLDYYLTKFDDRTGRWLPPLHLPNPLSTNEDDMFLSLPASGDLIYFSSNREDFGKDNDDMDVYVAHVETIFKAIVLNVNTIDIETGLTIPSIVTIQNEMTGREVRGNTSIEDSVVKYVVNSKDFGNSRDSVKYVDIKIKTENDKYGEKEKTVRVNNPEIEAENEYREFTSNLGINLTYATRDDSEINPVKTKGSILESNADVELKDEEKNTLIKSDTVIYDQIPQQTSFPLLKYIFFEHNSSDIPDRYIKIKSSEEYYQPENNGLNLYYNILNIVGKRMKEYSQDRIKLIGTNSNFDKEKDNIALSEARAKSIKDYLVNVWDISSNRIKIDFRNLPEKSSNTSDSDGMEENQRVEIDAPDRILEPIISNDTVYNVIPPVFTIKRPVNVVYGDAFWNVKFIQDNVILKEFNGDGSMVSDLSWRIKDDFPKLSSEKPIIVETETKDKYIQKTIVDKDTVFVEILTMAEKEKLGQKLYRNDKFNLILFDFGSSTLGKSNNEIVNFINKKIDNDSKVQVFGYTDRTGDDEINERISKKRAYNVNNLIRAKNKMYRGFGESTLLFDNNTPEGRFYCRTVEVNVQNEIE